MIAWTMSVCNWDAEHEQVRECLAMLRSHSPKDAVVLRTDGSPDIRWESVRDEFRTTLRYGPRLYGVESGGDVVAEHLACSLSPYPGRVIGGLTCGFKIDPDTRVRRPLRWFPDPAVPALFGTVQQAWGRTSVQGGCVGWTAAAAARLLNSGVLTSDELKRDPTLWTGGEPVAEARRVAGITSFDWTLGWAATRLEIPMWDHPEVYSSWLGTVPRRYAELLAVTHPHKEPR